MCAPTRAEMCLRGPAGPRDHEVLTDGALGTVRTLHARYDERRRALLSGPASAQPATAWRAVLDHQLAVLDAVAYDADEAAVAVRPPALDVDEPHLLVRGVPVAAGLLVVGLHLHHHARRLVADGRTPYVEPAAGTDPHQLAWWRDVLGTAERWLGLPAGAVRAAEAEPVAPAYAPTG